MKKDNLSYEYWQNEVMDDRLIGLDTDERYELYLQWYNEQKTEENFEE